jgi:hypothetical protein
MMVVVLVAGIGLLLAGILAIVFGIPVKEFSFGNTLILVGAVSICTGMVMLALWNVVRELKHIARQLGGGVATEARLAAALHPAARGAAPGHPAHEDGGFLFDRDQPAPPYADAPPGDQSAAPPWHEEAASRDRGRGEVPPPVPESAETAAAPKARRNLLFSSTSRKERERERAQTRTTELPALDPRPGPPVAPPPFEPSEAPPASFDDAWPKIERARAADVPPRRTSRPPVTSSEPGAGAPAADRYPPAARSEEQPPVTILKSGVVDGMAYSLYSDGSIEAQMPEGMMRFASIDELRAHLDQRT